MMDRGTHIFDFADEGLFKRYYNTVLQLADKLPQWDEKSDVVRVRTNAIASLYEEAGEIAGIVSKKRIRKHYYGVEPSTLSDFDEIKQKFIDETGDLIWVLTCSAAKLYGLNVLYKMQYIEDIHPFSIKSDSSLEKALFNFIHSLGEVHNKEMVYDFCNEQVLLNLTIFLEYLWQEYQITLTEILQYNLEKLGVRYDKDGKRTDESTNT